MSKTTIQKIASPTPYEETFLIECNRAGTNTDSNEGDANAFWNNEANFNIKKGDRISVEMCAMNVPSTDANKTIEFTHENVIQNGKEQNFVDNKVLLEVLFYVNNHQVYTNNLPIRVGSAINDEQLDNSPVLKFPIVKETSRIIGLGMGFGCEFDSTPLAANAVFGEQRSLNDTQFQTPNGLYPNPAGATPSYANSYRVLQVLDANLNPIAFPIPLNAEIHGIVLDDTQGVQPPANQFPTNPTNYEAWKTLTGILNYVPLYAMAGMKMVMMVIDANNDTVPYLSLSKISQIVADNGRAKIIFEDVAFADNVTIPQYTAICLKTEANKQELRAQIGYENIDLLGREGPPNAYNSNPEYAPPRQNMGFSLFWNAPQGLALIGGAPNSIQNPAYPQGATGPVNTIAYRKEGNIGSDNRLQGNDGLPYILTNQSYQGTRAKANGEKLGNNKTWLPKLEPMTAFIMIEAEELLNDVQSLAEKINKTLHASLPTFGNNQQNINAYNTNAFGYAQSYKKSSEIIPAVNYNGFFPQTNYANTTSLYEAQGPNAFGGWKPEYNQQWDNIAPFYNGGCMKIIPANFQAGYNQLIANVGKVKPITQGSAEETYLRTCFRNPSEAEDGDSASYNNCILGNMGLLDFPKMRLGDRFQRLPVWDGNTTGAAAVHIQDDARDFNRPVILNNQFQYVNLQQQLLQPIINDPVVGNNVTQYPATNLGRSTVLIKNQMIFTNIPYGTQDIIKYRAVTTNATANLYPAPELDFSYLDDLIEPWKYYQQYINTQSQLGTFEEQETDKTGFAVELDLGAGDDEKSCALSTVTEYNANQPNAPNTQGLRGINFNWTARHPAYNPPPNPAYSTYSQAQTVFPRKTYSAFATNPTQLQGANNDIKQNWDWNENSNTLRPLGRLLVQSRYDPNWARTSNYGGDPGGQFSIKPRSVEVPDAYCLYKTADDKPLCDDTWSKQNDMGVYPYEYTDDAGLKYVFCAFRVAQDYRATLNVNDNEKLLSSVRIGEICWGTPIGVDVVSRYSNFGVTPMNFEECPTRGALTQGAPNPVIFQASKNFPQNTIPYIGVGAPNATFQYNDTKNRMELLNTHTNNVLSAYNVNDTSGIPVQVGEQCGIINEVCPDAIFTPPNDGNLAPNPPTNGGGVERNKNIRAELSGIGIWKTWLLPKGYTPPPDINITSYWSNTPDEVQMYNGEPQRKFLANGDRNPKWRFRDNQDQTAKNRAKIIEGCTEATRSNWQGTLFNKFGFEYAQFHPIAGRPYNRYSQETFNNPNPELQQFGTKPLILNNTTDITLNPDLNIKYESNAGAGVTGLPNFGLGLNNNEPAVVSVSPDVLTARKPPSLNNSPFFQIYSNICDTHYQSGKTDKGILFYVMRNYQSGGFAYGYGSTYSVTADRDYTLSEIRTEIRNPISGKLAKCLSPNSVITYKITRDKTLAPNYYDTLGNPVAKSIPDIAPPPDITGLVNSMIEPTPSGRPKVVIPAPQNDPIPPAEMPDFPPPSGFVTPPFRGVEESKGSTPRMERLALPQQAEEKKEEGPVRESKGD